MKRIPRSFLVIASLAVALILGACNMGAPQVRQPGPFGFVAQTDVEPGAVVESNVVQLRSSNVPLPASVEGGDAVLLINGEVAGDDATAAPGAELQVRLTASTEFNGTVTATVTVGEVSALFSVTTRAASTTPNEFSFEAVTDAEPDSEVTSADVELTGFDGVAEATVEGNGVLIVNGALVAGADPVEVRSGDLIAVRVTTSPMHSTAVEVIVTVGGVSAPFTVTTRAPSTTPNEFTFDPVTDAALATEVTSNTVELTGFDGVASASIAGVGTLVLNGTDVIGSGPVDVEAGDNIAVRVTSAADFEVTVQTTVTVGGVNADFVVTTRASVDPEITAFASDTDTPEPGQEVTLSWIVTGDYDELILTNDLDPAAEVVLGLMDTSTIVTLPTSAPSISYTLSASRAGTLEDTASVALNIELWVCSLSGTQYPIEIPDLELRAAIVTELGVAYEDLDCVDMQALVDLATGNFDGNEGTISSLVGVQHATNLETLHVEWNQISDLAPIANLTTLTELNLDRNYVEDVSHLSGLTNLTLLGLWDNGPVYETWEDGLTDLSPIAGLTQLQTLFISWNNLDDLAAITDMEELRTLYANVNNITDLAPLANKPNLVELQLSYQRTQLTLNQDALAGLSALEILRLEGHDLTDTDMLTGLASLNDVDLTANLLTSVNGLAENLDFAAGDRLVITDNCLGPDADADITTMVTRGVTVVNDSQAACAAGFSSIERMQQREALRQEYLRQGNQR
ncbi:MAG: leucine-rich repeat domain-containing protein [Trueperaceae bacterium]